MTIMRKVMMKIGTKKTMIAGVAVSVAVRVAPRIASAVPVVVLVE